MGRWLDAWAAHLGEAWMIGGAILFLVAAVVFQGLVVVGLPLLLLDELLGWGGSWVTWWGLSAILWLPIFIGLQSRRFHKVPKLKHREQVTSAQ